MCILFPISKWKQNPAPNLEPASQKEHLHAHKESTEVKKWDSINIHKCKGMQLYKGDVDIGLYINSTNVN